MGIKVIQAHQTPEQIAADAARLAAGIAATAAAAAKAKADGAAPTVHSITAGYNPDSPENVALEGAMNAQAHLSDWGTINFDAAAQEPGTTGTLIVGGKYSSQGAKFGELPLNSGGYSWSWEPGTRQDTGRSRLLVKGPPTVPFRPKLFKQGPRLSNTQSSSTFLSFGGDSSNDWSGPVEWIFGQFGDPDAEILGAQAEAEIAAKYGTAEAAEYHKDPGAWIALWQLRGAQLFAADSNGLSAWFCPDWPPALNVGKIVVDGLGVVVGAVAAVVTGGGGAAGSVAAGVSLAGDFGSPGEPATSSAVQAAAAQQQALDLQHQSAMSEQAALGYGLPQAATFPLTPAQKARIKPWLVGGGILAGLGLAIWAGYTLMED
jgi:hypothetical protein